MGLRRFIVTETKTIRHWYFVQASNEESAVERVMNGAQGQLVSQSEILEAPDLRVEWAQPDEPEEEAKS